MITAEVSATHPVAPSKFIWTPVGDSSGWLMTFIAFALHMAESRISSSAE